MSLVEPQLEITKTRNLRIKLKSPQNCLGVGIRSSNKFSFVIALGALFDDLIGDLRRDFLRCDAI